MRRIIIIFFLLLLLLAIAGGGAVFLAIQGNKSVNNSTAKILNNPIVAKMADKLPVPKITMTLITPALPVESDGAKRMEDKNTEITQNWSIYKNRELNFAVNYPPDLQIKETVHGMGVYEISFSNNTDKTAYLLLIYPKSIGRLIGQDFDELYNLAENSTHLMTSQSSTPRQFTKIKNLNIDGSRAFEFRLTSDPPDPKTEAERGIYIEVSESTLIFSASESKNEILENMLSTFDFL